MTRFFAAVLFSCLALAHFSSLSSSVPAGPLMKLPALTSLEYTDDLVKQHRDEVKENLNSYMHGQTLLLTFRRYQVRENDSFFHIMTRTMLDHDTLSTINNLTTLWDIEKGDSWIIPNMRGIAVSGDWQKKYGDVPAVPVPGKPGFYFLPGRHLEPAEKSYFNLTGFIRPVEGYVSSPYGTRVDPFTQKKKFHKGIDIACPLGSPVRASAAGKVIFTGEKGGYGKLVIIEHAGGYRSYYGHLSKIEVSTGETVAQGKRIASSGQTGRATGPHLHYEISKKGKTITPHFDAG